MQVDDHVLASERPAGLIIGFRCCNWLSSSIPPPQLALETRFLPFWGLGGPTARQRRVFFSGVAMVAMEDGKSVLWYAGSWLPFYG